MDPAGMAQHNQRTKATNWHQVYTTGYSNSKMKTPKTKNRKREGSKKNSLIPYYQYCTAMTQNAPT